MPYQKINASLSPADVQAAKEAFETILNKLPFLVNPTVEGRRASFSAPDFENAVDVFAVLTELSTLVASLASQIEDTRLVVGGEAMQKAIEVYHYVKEAAKTTPSLQPLADQLGEQFEKATKPQEPAKPRSSKPIARKHEDDGRRH